jgi:hypothetical protein
MITLLALVAFLSIIPPVVELAVPRTNELAAVAVSTVPWIAPVAVIAAAPTVPVNVGLAENTADPLPVSFVRADANCAEVNDPRTAAFPTEVTCPVRLALVVTLPAVKPEAVPVIFVPIKADGVPASPLKVKNAPALPTFTARAVATLVPRPDTPVLIGKPVAFVSVADAGVPNTGATRVNAEPSVVAPVIPPKEPELLYCT